MHKVNCCVSKLSVKTADSFMGYNDRDFLGHHTGTATAVGVSKLSVKKDPLEIQHPKLENSRLGFIESFHAR